MAYQTGTASGAKAVIQALATFLSSNGWTVDNNAAYTTGGAAWWVALHKGSTYIDLVTDSATDGQISLYGATGFSSGSAPSAQANTSTLSYACNPGAGPYQAYHFFTSSSGTYAHVMIEMSTNLYAHLMFGALNAVGGVSPAIYVANSNWTYTGGTYASYWDSGAGVNVEMAWHAYGYDTHVGCTVDGGWKWFKPFGAPGVSQRMKLPLQASYGQAYGAILRTPNAFNGLTPLFPIHIAVERASGNIYSPVGTVPDMRVCNHTNYSPKDEITIGSDVWKVFPPIQKTSPAIWNQTNQAPSSGPYGFAFKKNA